MATKRKERKPMELEVSDFGPIARAKIDLRPLTVFVGPSNTGKSYLAILIYALHRFFRGFLLEVSVHHPRRTHVPIGSWEGMRQVREWAKSVLRDEAMPKGKRILIPPEVARFVWEYISSKGIGGIGTNWLGTVERVFGISRRDLIRYGASGKTNIVVRSERFDQFHPLTWLFRITEDPGVSIHSSEAPLFIDANDPMISDDALLLFTEDIPDERYESLADDLANEFIGTIAGMAIAPLIGSLKDRAYYLPADRTGIMHAHQLVVSLLIRRATRARFHDEAPLGMLSGVLADFLEQLVRLNDAQGKQSSGVQIAEEIESAMLSGEIRADKSVVNYPFFTYRPSGWRRTLPLMNTSSMVSELAPIVLYLRHVAQHGNTLIIEEPEAHLHPGMQREFTRQIATMIQAGIRVIITTHSEWVLEELANLVYLSALPKEQARRIDESAPALTPDQVGVWLFEPKKRPRGSVVREIPLDKEIGSFDSGFTEVSRLLYNTWAEIANQAQEDIG